MMGQLDPDMMKEIYKGIFGAGPKKLSRNDCERIWDAIFSLDVGFKDASGKVLVMTLVLPAARMKGEREDFDRVMRSMAERLSKALGKEYVPATFVELVAAKAKNATYTKMLAEHKPEEGEA